MKRDFFWLVKHALLVLVGLFALVLLAVMTALAIRWIA